MKKCILIIIGWLFMGCHINRQYDNEILEILNERLYINKVDKKDYYYQIEGINIANDTISIISYTDAKLLKRKKNKVKIRVGETYEFKLMKVNIKVVNGISDRGHIIIKNDTLWSGDIILNRSSTLMSTQPQFYESLNSKGLILYN